MVYCEISRWIFRKNGVKFYVATQILSCNNTVKNDIKQQKVKTVSQIIEYNRVIDKDDTIIISGNNIDIIFSGANEKEALNNFINDILE